MRKDKGSTVENSVIKFVHTPRKKKKDESNDFQAKRIRNRDRVDY